MSNFSPEQIRLCYIERSKEITFPSNLKKPTEARLKKACLTTYKKKNTQRDKLILRDFLEVSENADVELSLKRAEVGKFRPVVNFFKNETKVPRDETIQLAAWLIDFKYESSLEMVNDDEREKENSKEQSDVITDEEQETTGAPTKEEEDEVSTRKKTTNRKKPIFKDIYAIATVFAMMIAITSGLASVLFSNKKESTPFSPFTGKEKYMYWLGDHYQPTNNARVKGVNIIPYNAKMVSDFRKITDPDTLTSRSIGKVWYVKVNKQPEFYTTNGFHPGDTQRILKPLTKYMADKYTIANKNLITLMQMIFGISLLVSLFLTYIAYRKNQKKLIT